MMLMSYLMLDSCLR